MKRNDPIDIRKIILANIQTLKNYKVISDSDIASALNLKYSGYKKFERGETTISVKKLWALSNLFSVPIDLLFCENSETLLNKLNNNKISLSDLSNVCNSVLKRNEELEKENCQLRTEKEQLVAIIAKNKIVNAGGN